MYRKVFAATLIGTLIFPSVCFALMFSIEGNRPRPSQDYEHWPGLVDVVNQPSRQRLVWCNGSETLSFAGDTAALNTTLRLFAKVECATHTVVIRPGPIYDNCDWVLYVEGGISRIYIERQELHLVHDLDPRLHVYVGEDLKLDSLVIPPGVEVQQIGDLRERYVRAQRIGNDLTKSTAARRLKALDEDPVLETLGKDKYQARARRIAAFVQRLPADD